MQRLISYLAFSFITLKAHSQSFPEITYPKNYFSRPLAIPVSLAGNFGDLRYNHYHMGLDFRTNQKENLAVMAAAEGYVSRVKVEPYGYGRVIFITHPNGFVTLYAHLNQFFQGLENYTRIKQYTDKSWQQDFELPPGLFKIYKGQFIAYSGNTGSSEGPHLHFEIRDAKTGHNLNPLLFGLGIGDHVAPSIYRLALYNRDKSIYESMPIPEKIKKYNVKNKKDSNYYVTADSVVKVPFGKFSFGIDAEDKTNQSFMFGIYQAELYKDSSLACAFRLNDFSYDDSRYINAGIDYAARQDGGAYIQHLSRLPGNKLPIFDMAAGDGVIQLNDDSIHEVLILVKDVMNNQAELRFRIQRDSSVLFSDRFAGPGDHILLPGIASELQDDTIRIILDKNTVYDSVCFRYNRRQGSGSMVSAIHSISDTHIPVHDSFTVRIKADSNITELARERTVMTLRSGSKRDAQKGKWEAGSMETKWCNFGNFMLVQDTIKPVIIPLNVYDSAVFIRDRQLVFRAMDETGDLASFEGLIDEQWVIFKQKNNVYTYEFDDHCGVGWHVLKIMAKDVAGNIQEYSCSFHNGAIPAYVSPGN